MFKLHPNFSNHASIVDLDLCTVLLQDRAAYPWVLLVPRLPNLSKLMDLKIENQLKLVHEMDLVQNILWKLFLPDQLNVAAIGNKTPQLHIHIIARYLNDPAWPDTVWDHSEQTPYTSENKKIMIENLQVAFAQAKK